MFAGFILSAVLKALDDPYQKGHTESQYPPHSLETAELRSRTAPIGWGVATLTQQNLVNVPGDVHDAAAQIVSRGTPLSAAHDVEMLLVEWHLTPDGQGGQPPAP